MSKQRQLPPPAALPLAAGPDMNQEQNRTPHPADIPADASIPPMQRERFDVGCLVKSDSGPLRVVLGYFDDKRGDPKVALGTPGRTPDIDYMPLRSLEWCTRKNLETYPEPFKRLIAKYHLQGMIVGAFKELRKLQASGERDVPIPLHVNFTEVRPSLFAAIIPRVIELVTVEGNQPPFTVGGVSAATVMNLVAQRFEKKERPTKIEAEPRKHTVVKLLPDATSFPDRREPLIALDTKGRELQLVGRLFIETALNRTLTPGEARVSRSEVTKWIKEHLTPVKTEPDGVPKTPAMVGSNKVRAYLLSEVLEKLDKCPVRSNEPHLNSDGRGIVPIGEHQVGVVGVHALANGKTVQGGSIVELLGLLDVVPIPGITMKPADRGRPERVFAASDVDRFNNIFWSSDGLELPTGDRAAPSRRVSLLTDKIGSHERPHLVEGELASRGITPVKLADLGLVTTRIPGKGARRGVEFHEVEIPGQTQKSILMTNPRGEVVVQWGQHHSDFSPVYWEQALVEGLAQRSKS